MLQMVENDRSDDISTNDDDMIQSILHSLFSPPPTIVTAVSAAESSGCGRYKKDIRNCTDHDDDSNMTPPPVVLDEGKNSNNINDDTTIATTSTLPPP